MFFDFLRWEEGDREYKWARPGLIRGAPIFFLQAGLLAIAGGRYHPFVHFVHRGAIYC
jgi:hypothetical protein